MESERYRVQVADDQYWLRNIPCMAACPVKTDARGYVLATAAGEFEKGYEIARKPNPLASVCGRVCGAPCERACRRGVIDEPVAIRAIKGFLTSRCGVEAPQPSAASLNYNPEKKRYNTGPRVAIVGSGPGGLVAAHDLAKLGYQVTVFEQHPEPGGMCVIGVPFYRLDREIVRKEIKAIENIGVEFRCNARIGPGGITISDLREQGYKSIIIAVGMQNPRRLPMEGTELEGVLFGVEFIRDYLLGRHVKLGRRVVVVGGGNVAFDASRSAVRFGPEEVIVTCVESLEEMPADDFEIEEGVLEGLKLLNRRGPKRVIGEEGRVVGLETLDVASVFDEQGRFNPQYIPGSERVIPCDTVIFTIGQAGDFSFLEDKDGIKVTRQGTIQCSLSNGAVQHPHEPLVQMTSRGSVDYRASFYATDVEGIFAIGDIAIGPRLIIDAEATGQAVAAEVDRYLNRRKRRTKLVGRHRLLPNFRQMTVALDMPTEYHRIARRDPDSLSHSEAVRGFRLVEQGYNEEQARKQGSRCLKCHVNTIFDGEKCIVCNGCVDICPENCLKLVDITQVVGDEVADKVISAWNELNGIEASPIPGRASVMLKDESACIRCALCAARCPTDAITMEEFIWEEVEEDVQ